MATETFNLFHGETEAVQKALLGIVVVLRESGQRSGATDCG